MSSVKTSEKSQWPPFAGVGNPSAQPVGIYFDDGVCGIEAGVGFEHEGMR